MKKVQLHAEYLQELTAALEGVESGDIGDYRRLAAELPVLLEIQEEVLELEESPLWRSLVLCIGMGLGLRHSKRR